MVLNGVSVAPCQTGHWAYGIQELKRRNGASRPCAAGVQLSCVYAGKWRSSGRTASLSCNFPSYAKESCKLVETDQPAGIVLSVVACRRVRWGTAMVRPPAAHAPCRSAAGARAKEPIRCPGARPPDPDSVGMVVCGARRAVLLRALPGVSASSRFPEPFARLRATVRA